jgi:small subunit ribosomal protein S24e
LSTFELTTDVENPLLRRRELQGVFRAGNGLLTRKGASEGIATKIGVDPAKVTIISLKGKFGTRDVSASAYVFSEEPDAKKQLAKYLFVRSLSKEERAKLREEKKKAKTAGPKPVASPKPAASPSEPPTAGPAESKA